ncbi:NTPase KAP family P-loop domain-containing protein 1 [Varanus komodoensis]|uniref:NTPase KAP family P-loop domain-containing protein 1-like isoform X2 n=1 Tax=Varanus komodoensis TaxID=61221 RepID=UPI001CF7A723|nr:NTPase KAP family P-loop domain-containing protein 1-like isoform X2 [Varanus komodoensis]KAF7242238.1 NTPase KAP family P-loop domain-containing protein 1 [Varanus komodoensis]
MLPSTREFQHKDDAYCFSLAKALFCVSTPVTVGFYAPWGHCKDFLLTRIQDYMHLQSWKKDSQELQRTGLKQRGTSGWDLVSAVLLMIFYRPVLTLQHRQRRNVRHIFIRFSAWEYAGSDQLWAGLITALCDGIEGHFGLVPVSVYRAVGRKCGLVEAPLRKEWVSKRYLCLPLWAAVLLVGGAGVGVAILVLLFGVPIGNASGDAIAVAEGLGATAVGITAAAALRMGAMVVRNVVITQKAQLERQMNRTDLSAQLGFMSNVKREVQTITSFLQFMEIFQRRKLRVVLEVTSLDHCSPDRVVGVLDAMNILLSDNEAPFISILVADPSIIVGCVESSLYMKGMANNGYEFLNRIVTLPFSVPKTDSDTKLQLMRSIVTYREEQEKSLEEEEGLGVDVQPENQAGLFLRLKLCLCPNARARSRAAEDGLVPLVVVSPGKAEPPKRCGKGFKAKDLIQEAFEFLLDENTKLYLTDNVVQMKRVINTISVMIRLMATQVPREKLCPQKVASWVLLASQWPCRLSWILQCIEDDEQMGRLGVCQGGQLGPDLLLWDVYEKNLEEFVMFASQLEKLLELDGDPELFHSFLSGRFQVKDARFFVLYTVNMDSSLKRHMELLRGSHGLKSSKRAPGLSRCLLLGMSVEEVCEELGKLGLKAENAQWYRERLKEHGLDGRALACSDRGELKEALGMGLGEWTAFSTHFLGSAPPRAPFPAAAPPAPPFAGKPGQGPGEKRLPGSRLSPALSEECRL